LLGVKPATAIDEDQRHGGFSSAGGFRLTTSPDAVEKYRAAALEAAAAAWRDPKNAAALVGCAPAAAADPCVDGFLTGFGRRAFRRPLSSEELADYKRIVSVTAAEQGSLARGLEYAVAAFLQDVNFLYEVIVGELDPADPSRHRLTDWELASRLSFFLVDSIPDDPLLNAAERRRLATPEGIRAEVARLLASPRGAAGARAFFAEHLGHVDLAGVTKDKKVYPAFDAALLSAMRGELDRLLGEFSLSTSRRFSDLFTTRETFANKRLAAHYGLPVVSSDDLVPVRLPDAGPRGGLLTTAGLLSVYAFAGRTSPTERGMFVRERILCQQVPEPPDGVAQLENRDGGTGPTLREMLERHRRDPACSACHSFFDPIGLAFENFDGIGAVRANQRGAGIDTRGEMDGVPFEGPRDLSARLGAHERTATCLVKELYHFALGHEARPEQGSVLEALRSRFSASGGHIVNLIADLVASPAFGAVARPQ
jgi:hypothetical protein